MEITAVYLKTPKENIKRLLDLVIQQGCTVQGQNTKKESAVKCPSTEEWIKMWYLCVMEYYSAKKKRNAAICHNMMDLETVTLSEVRQRQIHDITYMWNLF